MHTHTSSQKFAVFHPRTIPHGLFAVDTYQRILEAILLPGSRLKICIGRVDYQASIATNHPVIVAEKS
jgi:hypothetical protein